MHTQLFALLSRLEGIQGDFCTVSPERSQRPSPGAPESYTTVWEDYSPLKESALPYSLLEASGGRHLFWAKLSPEELLQSFAEKKLWRKASIVFCPAFFSSSDYGGSLVELSNLQAFLEDHGKKPGVWELYGSYGSSGLALDVRFIDEDMLEELSSLQDYHVVSWDHLFHLELEKEQEAWEDWAREDYRKELQKRLEELFPEAEETIESRLEELEEEKLFSLFQQAMESGNVYWKTEATSRYVDCQEVAAHTNLNSLLSFLGASS